VEPGPLTAGDVALLRRAAAWAGRELGARELDLLGRLSRWLVVEALPAEGIGPREGPGVVSRHVADSLLLAAPLPLAARTHLDVGSGVGLPGLPLAVVFPGAEVVLADRSGRRCRLARRAVRVLGLDNVTVLEADVADLDRRAEGVVSRGALPPEALRPVLSRLVADGGVAVVAGSTARRPEEPGFVTLAVPADVLGEPRWLLVWRP